MESNTINAIKIGLASPEKIREWSYGEVKKPETINFRTLKPEKDGLFCERIFGPTNDWQCSCGKYKRMRYKDKVCERCGVTVTKAKVRRERMGHIELAAPVSHIWYFKGIPSRMGIILDVSPWNLEKVLYFAMYIVIDPGDTPLQKYQMLDERECAEFRERYENDFRVGMGAEAIKELLAEIDLDKLSDELHEEMENSAGQKKAKALKRLEVVEAFRLSGNRPEWMILDVIPVIPPDIRPMIKLDGGRFATSHLNDLYRRVINRNNRTSKLLELGAPEIIVRNEKRMLQEAVDALIDNGRRGRHVTDPSNRALMSLSDMLRGKQGRFRQNLLGKRVDYSGRSVIVVGPELKLYQCGLPKEMALELFKPFVMKRLVETEVAGNVKSARKMVECSKPQVWDALEIVIKDHPVMLNRAPTLHRLGIQAFEPVLVEGRAIKLHPLVCTAFNADFDGDQMAVHVPLSAEAQAEARFLMLAANNLLKPSDGLPVTVPTQDMVLGSYYLTLVKPSEPGEGKVFRDVNEATMAYDEGDLGLHAVCKIRMTKEIDGETVTKLVETTLGKVIFNDPIPQDLGFVDRSIPENVFRLEIEKIVDKSQLGKIIDRCIRVHGTSVAAEVLDKIKSQGYRYSTRSGITVAVNDATIPPAKRELIEEAEAQITKIRRNYERGLISNDERSDRVIETWDNCTKNVAKALMENFDEFNPINMMLKSGARGNESQLRQLAGMRGLIANTAGKTIEVPIRANYREGLNILEYFISSRGARKGLADKALYAPDFIYLTRRLVDVSHDVIIRQKDCGCHDGIDVYDIYGGKRRFVSLTERLTGRFLLKDYIDSETGELIQSCDKMMSENDATKVAEHVYAKNKKDIADGTISADSFAKIKIRSLLSCEAEHGVCIKCYGANLATGDPVTVGEAVGIIAAQSIGEPGTQLTMRTFHTGGAKDQYDITSAFLRIEELFEARKPRTLAILAEISGTVSFRDIKKTKHVIVTSDELGEADERAYLIPYGYRIKVEEGQHVRMGETITEGALNPHDVLAVLGVNAVHDYLIKEVQRTYRLQGVDINDKHIEVIVRQMMKKVKVEDPGDTDLLPGLIIQKRDFAEANANVRRRAEAEGIELKEAVCVPTLMGITKASLATESFLSAASFQETTRVLTDAAIKGKTDLLLGLKENVIIGNLIPAGTGIKCCSDVELERDATDYMIELSEKLKVVLRTDDDTSNQSASADLAAYSCSVGHKSDKEQITVGENDNQNLDTLVQRDVFSVSTAFSHTVILKPDGTVIAIGNNNQGQCCVSGWRYMVAISTGRLHTVGLKSDGTAVAVGNNNQGQCCVSDWKDIVAISTGRWHTVGLKSDGTVVAVGDKKYGTCDVSGWKDIVAISAGDYHTVGLKSDGMVIAVGNNDKGQCSISGWKDIVAISAGIWHTVGLKPDGMVIATGNNDQGQCDVTSWRNIDAISAGGYHTVGLKSNRTVVATDYTGDYSDYYDQCDVSEWTNIVAISAGKYHTVGIISDGTIVTTEHQDDLKNYEQPFEVRNNYPKALQLGNDNLKPEFIEHVGFNKDRNESEQKQVDSAVTKEEFKSGTGALNTDQDFNNADAKAKECIEKAKTARKELIYSLGLNKMHDAKTEEEFKAAANDFITIPGFENADVKAKEFLEKAETVRKDTILADAAEKQKKDDIVNLEWAIRIFESIAGWKDADERAVDCKNRIEEIKVHNRRIAEEERTAEQNIKKKTKRQPAIIALMKKFRQQDKFD